MRQCSSRMPSSVRRSKLVEGDQEPCRSRALVGQGAQASQVRGRRRARDALTSIAASTAAAEPMRKSTSTPLWVRQ